MHPLLVAAARKVLAASRKLFVVSVNKLLVAAPCEEHAAARLAVFPSEAAAEARAGEPAEACAGESG